MKFKRGNKASIHDVLVASPKHFKEPRVKEKEVEDITKENGLQHFKGLNDRYPMPKKENGLERHKHWHNHIWKTPKMANNMNTQQKIDYQSRVHPSKWKTLGRMKPPSLRSSV